MLVLLVEDSPGDARLIREMLRDARGGADVLLEHVTRLADGEQRLALPPPPDLLLLDLSLPDCTGLETFRRARAAAGDTLPIVVLSGSTDQHLALAAVQEGAQDYLVKGSVDGAALMRAIQYAIERGRLEEARRALERHKDEFFSSVSHDLRTPVAAIHASARVLQATPEITNAPESVRHLLVNITLAADELAHLVADLLDLSRLQAGRVELWKEPADLVALARRAMAALEPLAAARHQTLVLDAPPEPLSAVVDAQWIARVVQNLLANANKYGGEGSTLRVSLRPADNGICISVADQGAGIPLAEQEAIFQRFYRASSASVRAQVGSGLGLPIAKGLVELHGGRIRVESQPGAGATFHVWLPTGEAQHAAA